MRVTSFFLSTCALIIFNSPSIQAMYSKTSSVISLTDYNFKNVSSDSKFSYIVEFFSPQCGYCHQLAPEYEKVANELGEMVKVCAVDCTLNFKACQGIKGFPTIKFYPSSGLNKPKKELEYQGERNANAIIKYIKQNTTSLVFRISNNEKETKTVGLKDRVVSWKNFLEKGKELPKIIHVKSKSTDSSFGSRNIAAKYHHSIVIGEVWKSDNDVIKQIIPNGKGVSDTIGVYRNDKFEPFNLTFPLKYSDLMKQIEQLLNGDAKTEL